MKLCSVLFATLSIAACASKPLPLPPVKHVQARDDDRFARREERANAAVGVRGIEGTLSSFDVRVTMEKRGAEFAACHEPRANVVPVLAGSVELGIHVRADGTVSQVDVRASDLGDRALERCLVDVVAATHFPRPNGGDANVTWTMAMEPARPGRGAEAWTADRIGRLAEKRTAELRESCSLSAGDFTVTAYVDARGHVVAAGVASREGASPDQLDCIVQDLLSWPMPKAKRRWAKVSFALRTDAS